MMMKSLIIVLTLLLHDHAVEANVVMCTLGQKIPCSYSGPWDINHWLPNVEKLPGYTVCSVWPYNWTGRQDPLTFRMNPEVEEGTPLADRISATVAKQAATQKSGRSAKEDDVCCTVFCKYEITKHKMPFLSMSVPVDVCEYAPNVTSARTTSLKTPGHFVSDEKEWKLHLWAINVHALRPNKKDKILCPLVSMPDHDELCPQCKANGLSELWKFVLGCSIMLVTFVAVVYHSRKNIVNRKKARKIWTLRRRLLAAMPEERRKPTIKGQGCATDELCIFSNLVLTSRIPRLETFDSMIPFSTSSLTDTHDWSNRSNRSNRGQ